jgi:hypothetical protein
VANDPLFGFGNGDSSKRTYIKAYLDANNVPNVYIQFRDGSTTGTYWYYNNVVTDAVAQGDKLGVYIERTTDGANTRTRIYINGVLATPSTIVNNSFTEPTTTMKLGAVTSNNEAYTKVDSRLDSFHVFNRPLTEAEIISLQP